ncbi:MAG: hypothetical protein ABMA64_08370, partial [Myxococcota bacterium]
MLDAASALRHLHHDLGSAVQAHGFADGRAAVRASLRSLGRPLVAVLCCAASDATVARTWFGLDVETLEVDDGWLVVGRAALPADRHPVPDTVIDDLDPQCVARWHARAGTDKTALAALGVLSLDGAVWRPTVAAFVLAGQDPHRRVPACTVRAQIDGRVTTHVGAIPQLLDAVHPGRVDPWLVRGAVANALLHRSWDTDHPVRVRIAGDRLEVANPGVLGRTPRLAHELAVAAGLIEPVGALEELTERLRVAHLPAHEFLEPDGWVVFTARLPAPARRPP